MVKTIIATLVAPGLVNRLAARRAWDGQFDETAPPPESPRPDNLFAPLPGDWGAHGRFDERAKATSWELWLALYRGKLLLALATIVVGVLIWQW